ncbi:acetylcholine receptor subunit beta-type lev-1-like [Mercenaria mercenaria]|uniref:acetylcholine receptor subunit beta-type lev-1-like n=1 Tax=Mercenaria mercenaria TaxID=6596 RepID=UPI00234E8E84|nr:acetylcholine receptor subunit beta-type lev-1-like [Mercenaria mercenaria]
MVENADDGTIDWWPMELFETSCAVDMTYFPFDIQVCEIQFMPWSYAGVKIKSEKDSIDLSYYSTNALWDVLDTSVEITEVTNVDLISFKLKLQRKPQHHILTLFLPVLLLATLNIFAQVLPTGGDRSGYAVTVFLAFTVFLSIAESVMPPNSEKVSLFSVYLVIQTTQSTLITILAVLLTRAESMDDNTKIPRFLVFLERLCRGVCQKKTTAKVNPHAKETKLIEIDNHADDDGRFSPVKDTDEADPCTWAMVVAAIDKLAFILFSVVFILSTTVFLCVMSLGPN